MSDGYRTKVIVNPASANGATGKRWGALRAGLSEVLKDWDSVFTLEAGDAARLAKEAADEGYQMIAVVGGDGTLSEALTGLLPSAPDATALIRKDLVFAPIRSGTGGDFCRMLGLSHRLPEQLGHLAGTATRPCDVGVSQFVDSSGAPRRRAFLNVAGFGLAGLVSDRVNQTTKMLGGRTSFLLGTLSALSRFSRVNVRLRVDGQPFYEGPCVTVAAANGRHFGGGMTIAKNAAIDDGLLEIIVVKQAGLREISSARDLYNGEIWNWDSVCTIRGKKVEAECLDDQLVLLDLDGEQPGQLPASFSLLPQAIQLKVRGSGP